MVYKTDFDCYELLIKMDTEGHYVGWVKYRGVKIGPPKFTIISLSGEIIKPNSDRAIFVCLFVCLFVVAEKNMQIVEKNVKKKNLNVWYEGLILEKQKKVYCYISPRVSVVVCLFTSISCLYSAIVSYAYTTPATSGQRIFHEGLPHPNLHLQSFPSYTG